MSIFRYIINNLNRTVVSLFLVLWILIIVYATIRMGYIIGVTISVIPLLILFFMLLVNNPYLGFIILFVADYFIMGLSRYIKIISPGIAMDVLIVITIVTLILNNFKSNSKIKFKNSFNGLTLVAFIWLIYCILQIFNPNSSSVIAWLTSVRALGIYFFLIVVITAIIVRKYKYFKRFLFIWAILALLAVFKAITQKMFGFDSVELNWLYVEGAYKTHIIFSQIRYFSFFTDAANFGTGIAFSGVVFAISSLYIKDLRLKIFFLITAALCGYGMIISGTRGSLAVPFVALAVFAVLSKELKLIILATLLFFLSFAFLKFTYYGHENFYIRRMRSIFNTEDASFTVRTENQRKLRTYLWNKPFGAGIGMSNGKATLYKPDPFLILTPSDSWYVRVWMDTGIVGLMLHLLILLYIIFHGAYLVFFRLKHKELKGLITSLICGISGIYVASYSLEIMGQFPTGFILYMCMTFIFLSPSFDKELTEAEHCKLNANETSA